MIWFIRREFPRFLFTSSLISCALIMAIGCGDDGGEEEGEHTDSEAERPVFTSIPQSPSSTSGCVADRDCAVGLHCAMGDCALECRQDADCMTGSRCDARGRCLEGASAEHPSGPSPDDEAPPREDLPLGEIDIVFENAAAAIVPADGYLELPLLISGTIPEQGLRYRVERSDIPNREGPVTLHRLMPGESAVRIPFTDPQLSETLDIAIFWETGATYMQVVPSPIVEGAWLGTVRLDGFGTAQLPVAMRILTVPPGSTLASASEVYLELEAREDLVISAHPTASQEGALRRPLEYMDDVGAWVARFETVWPLAEGTLPGAVDRERVNRSLRFELEPTGMRTMRGRVLDRWRGIVNRERSSGDLEVDVVEFAGELELTWTPLEGEARRAALPNTPVTPRTNAPPRAEACASLPQVWMNWPDMDTPAPQSVSDWDDLDPDERIETTLLVAADMLEERTTGQGLDALFRGDAGGTTIRDLIDSCSEASSCAETADQRCVRQLVARSAFMDRRDERADELISMYSRLVREATVGRQLTAFDADQRFRVDWLQRLELPSFVAAQLQGLVLDDLRQWRRDVLDVHMQALADFLDESSMAVLTLSSRSGALSDQQRIALDALQSWRAAVDSLATLARWYNRALDSETDRVEQAVALRTMLIELYRAAGVLRVAQQRLGLDGWGSSIANGYGAASEQIDLLETPYAALVFQRDGEIVLNTSLDPLTGQQGFLRSLEDEATRSTERAGTLVSAVINELETAALSEQQLEQRMEQEIRGVRQQLAQLCGIPDGCTASTVQDGRCPIPVGAGECGFLLQDGEVTALGTGGEGASEARRAIGRIDEANLGVIMAEDELDALMQRAALSLEEMEAHAADISLMRMLLLSGVDSTARAYAEVRHLRRDGIDITRDNLLSQLDARLAGMEEREQLESEIDRICFENVAIQQRANQSVVALRNELVDEQEQEIERWFTMAQENADVSYREVLEEFEVSAEIRRLQRRAGGGCGSRKLNPGDVLDTGLAGASGFGSGLGIGRGLSRSDDSDNQGNKVLGIVVGLAVGGASAISAGLRAGRAKKQARRCRNAINSMEEQTEQLNQMQAARERDQRVRSAQLTLARDEFAVRQARAGIEEFQIQASANLEREVNQCRVGVLQRAIQRSRDNENFRIAELQAEWQLDQASRQDEIQSIQEQLQVDQAIRSAELALLAEVRNLRSKQIQWQQMLTQIGGLELRINRAEMSVDQALDDYYAIVSRAEMLADQLEWLERQQDEVRSLVGSPAVVFGRANRIITAEAAVDIARERLLDWLVALEYEALRPFADQRVALLLARSPGQLEDVAAQLRLIRTRCGGNTSRQSAAVSVRFDVLGFDRPAEDPITEEIVMPGERFREWLAVSRIPVDRRIRYRVDSTLRESMTDRSSVLAGGVPLDLEDFANLGASCNARIESIGVELVGDVGFARPSVTVLYDGTARIRSCQPNLDGLLRDTGATSSSYAQVSNLRTPGRPASMVAALNQPPPPDQQNTSLAGLPLSSTYTLVITPDAGENASLNWDRLEDIILHISYQYQDPFVEGQCR